MATVPITVHVTSEMRDQLNAAAVAVGYESIEHQIVAEMRDRLLGRLQDQDDQAAREAATVEREQKLETNKTALLEQIAVRADEIGAEFGQVI